MVHPGAWLPKAYFPKTDSTLSSIIEPGAISRRTFHVLHIVSRRRRGAGSGGSRDGAENQRGCRGRGGGLPTSRRPRSQIRAPPGRGGFSAGGPEPPRRGHPELSASPRSRSEI